MDASKNSCDSIPDSSIDRVSQGDLRLNRAVASRGAIGRRKADSLIFGGKVKVNGIIETNPGRRVSATDELEINGVIRPPVSEKLYFMLNKPVHCVTTMSDPQSRATDLDLFPPEIRAHKIFPVGRLDYFSEGLLIFT
ncbi:MAG: pseudouridine synthase, partial [Desulfovibrio sp.]|nr:pseudouridine synthase [Desulfovibrio sp.]